MTQEQRVKNRLRERGLITRNECLQNYISRLGAIICDLKKDGWEFDIKRTEKDYVYLLRKDPEEKPKVSLPPAYPKVEQQVGML